MADPRHSESEDRFLQLGMSSSLRVLLLYYCYREEEEVIRIISARKATRNEAAQYGSIR